VARGPPVFIGKVGLEVGVLFLTLVCLRRDRLEVGFILHEVIQCCQPGRVLLFVWIGPACRSSAPRDLPRVSLTLLDRFGFPPLSHQVSS